MANAKTPPPLLYAAPESNADILYFGKVGAPDPFIALGAGDRKIAAVSPLEFSRVRRDSIFDVVLPLHLLNKRAKKTWPRRKTGPAEVICLLARKYGIRRFTVPEDFPAGLYHKVRLLGIGLDIADGLIFPEREVKSAAEVREIRKGNEGSAAGFAAAERVLRASRIRGGRLLYRGEVLTSERLKFEIETACLRVGTMSAGTICAGGNQACDPHDRGSGPLRPNQLIIIDIFPQVVKSGYHGDMTRTYLRGRPSEAQRKLVAAVRDAQAGAIGAIRAGVNGRDVHKTVQKIFKSRGYKTHRTAKGWVGFFHGTGHGLGLDVHEPGRMGSAVDYALKKGSVMTVEPGLYYPGLGGCRFEDVVQVTGTGCRMLSDHPCRWEL